MIVWGMCLQGLAILLIPSSHDFWLWCLLLILLGIGTAQVYPTLLAAVSDVADPLWRASAVGVYRLWRDLGYAAGAILSGVIADLFGVASSIRMIGVLTFCSGLLAAVLMKETRRTATERM